jgi:hypothetical protein
MLPQAKLVLCNVIFFSSPYFERTCIAITNLNQQLHTFFVIGIWIVFHHLTDLVLSNARSALSTSVLVVKGKKGGRK